MAKQINVGVGGAVKTVKKVPFSIGGVVKQAKKGVCGIGGVVKEFFTSNPLTFSFTSHSSGWDKSTSDGYLQINSGTETSGTGTRLRISGVAGHTIYLSVSTDGSFPRIYSWSSSSASATGHVVKDDGASVVRTIDCTSFDSTGYIEVYGASSKGWNYWVRIKEIKVDGESVLASLLEWASG